MMGWADSGHRVVDRRTFLGVIAGSLLAAPLAAEAQQQRGKISKIGVLAPSAERPMLEDVFEESLQRLGWVKEQNIRIEIRSPVGPKGAVAPAVAELMDVAPDVLVVWGTVGALAAKRATRQIPVEFLATGDPVSLGLVPSLAHPGGNLTGVPAIASSEEFAKRLALLKEAVPSVRHVALLVGPDGRTLMDLNRETLAAAASSLGLDLQDIQVDTPGELDAAVQQAKGRGVQALYIWPSGFALTSGKQLSDLALATRLPSVHPFTASAVAGGLLSYAASLADVARRGAEYVDKILRGAKPGELPVEQPTKFELVINLRTAKTLGLTIPPSLLQRADQVIE
jgi:putative tryptophan/tyrosine transport system substrate-binding protein